MSKSKIEWTDRVWNPVSGCSKMSQGCKNCYAETFANRFWGERKFTDVICHEDRLQLPLHWKKPSKIFVNSMSDLFHESVPDQFIKDVFSVMGSCPEHTFIILTKRPQRMLKLVQMIYHYCDYIETSYMNYSHTNKIPIPQIWLGVSVEDQETADERIPPLLQTPAAVRLVSAEPLLRRIDFSNYLPNWLDFSYSTPRVEETLDWVIVGGESGARARPMEVEWAINLKNQCKRANVPFFFKQGSKANWENFKDFDSFPEELKIREFPMDGVEYNEFPEVK